MYKALKATGILMLPALLCGCHKYAGGEGYTPVANWIFGQHETVSDGQRKRPQDVTEELPEIPVADDFKITVDGKTPGTTAYSLYDDRFEEICHRSEALGLPTAPGVYCLCMEVVWGRGREYDGYQCFAKLIKML